MALAFARAAARPAAAVAGAFVDSDGSDGGTDAAGGCVDSTTAPRAEQIGVCLDDAIAGHDSASMLSRLGDQIRTGPTGTNVSDLWAIAIAAGDPP
jgi:glycerate-2-kinase